MLTLGRKDKTRPFHVNWRPPHISTEDPAPSPPPPHRGQRTPPPHIGAEDPAPPPYRHRGPSPPPPHIGTEESPLRAEEPHGLCLCVCVCMPACVQAHAHVCVHAQVGSVRHVKKYAQKYLQTKCLHAGTQPSQSPVLEIQEKGKKLASWTAGCNEKACSLLCLSPLQRYGEAALAYRGVKVPPLVTGDARGPSYRWQISHVLRHLLAKYKENWVFSLLRRLMTKQPFPCWKMGSRCCTPWTNRRSDSTSGLSLQTVPVQNVLLVCRGWS